MTDLKDLLRNAAAEAENVSVDGSALLPHIRRRRRVRTAVVGAGSVAAVTTLAVGAYAVLPGAAPAIDVPVSGASPSESLRPDCDPFFYAGYEPPVPKTELRETTLEKRGNETWFGAVPVTFTAESQMPVPQPRLLLTPEQGPATVVGRGEWKAKTGAVLKPGRTEVEIFLTVRGCGRQELPVGTYRVYLSTMTTEGLFHLGKPITGVEPIGRLTLR